MTSFFKLLFSQFRDMMEPLISHYELQGDMVVIQMDMVSQ